MGIQQSNIPQLSVSPPPIISPDPRTSNPQFSLPAPPQTIVRTTQTNQAPIQNQNAVQKPNQNPHSKINAMYRP